MERITGLPALLLDRRLRRSFLCSLVLVIGIVIAPLSSQSASALEHQVERFRLQSPQSAFEARRTPSTHRALPRSTAA